ncbi:Sau3AI family type II restriction endonuclease [Mycoplasmopsis felis]|uniref:Sau3AI family type II restriction endonuclease n=1 Tax=Mycoplasmopsis felis TaxID=33923 RepID=UPI002AFE9C5B|nr:Sau3AI family type II restriction endonuclease [Mycoplasmopsis felis]WQQ04271.1 Sau3AI family type II restriction endonuclease [Mycoplasmopsis felis]
MKLPYDDNNVEDIFRYSQKLINKSFRDILKMTFDNKDELLDKSKYYDNPKFKGSLGNLIEEYFYFIKPNNMNSPDFKSVKLELKVTPFEYNKGQYKAAERLVITMIPNNKPISSDFENSLLKDKIQKLLLIWYKRNKEQRKIDYIIDFESLLNIYNEVFKNDLEIIKNDYKLISSKIRKGLAHTLSESDTKYLGACIKGSTSEKALAVQYYNSDIKSKRRAFCLKQSYMTYLLNNHINKLEKNESIIEKLNINAKNFDVQIIKQINKFVNYSETNLYTIFNINKQSKQRNKTLVLKILGINTENIDEFIKANIHIKTIRIKENFKPIESMSFPKFKINNFIKEKFEQSKEYKYFLNTRFLFVIFKENKDKKYKLYDCFFWNMPIEDLEGKFKEEWELYKNCFKNNINFVVNKNSNNKIVVYNDLPKKRHTKILHIRPHANNSAYVINGIKYGNGSDADMDLLPNGDKITSQCFWLNNDYISKVIKSKKDEKWN